MDWERVEKLRARGATWDEVAKDRKVGFRAPGASDPGRALKTLHRLHRSRDGSGSKRVPSTEERAPRRAGSRQKIVLVAILVVAVLVAVYIVGFGPNLNQKPTGWVGRAAPDFTLSVANGGGSFTLSTERGQENVLLFFNEGLSCSPCLGQMQQLDSDAARFQALHVLVVSITGDSLSDMTTWAQNSHVTHTVVLADPSLVVSNSYDTTGSAVSMMPGSAPGHTFILVDLHGVVQWRADYGPSDMSVPDSQILQAVQSALSG
jgi:peroxiredoxin Q/BCP